MKKRSREPSPQVEMFRVDSEGRMVGFPAKEDVVSSNDLAARRAELLAKEQEEEREERARTYIRPSGSDLAAYRRRAPKK